METELTKQSSVIDADGSFYWSVKQGQQHTVDVEFTTPGTGGSVELRKGNDVAYRDAADSANLAVDYNDTVSTWNLYPVAGKIRFEASGVTAGGSVAKVRVTRVSTGD